MGDYDHILKKKQAQTKQAPVTQNAPSDAAVLASSLAKGVAGIPDMFVNAAPSLVGLGMAGSGFVSNELAERLGRDTTLG
ncbi:MAG TPA: hypothetical protein PLN40_15170, partial [Agitococcus sp.]|nr:hypothetical protein [Agitococcus sp.]